MKALRFSQKPQVMTLAALLAFGMAGFGLARASQNLIPSKMHASLKLADPNEGPSKTGFAPVVKSVLPDVVNISSSKIVHASAESSRQMPNDPFFRQFFGQDFDEGQAAPHSQREEGLGS